MDDVGRHWRRDLHGPSTFGTFPLRLYNHHNHAHVPVPHMWLSASPWPDSKCSKQWKSGVHVKSIILSAQDRHWQNPRKKNWWRAQQYEKRTCQCTDWLSATPIGWGKAESFSRLRDSNQSPRPTANTLTTEPWFVSFCREKWFFTCSV